MTSQRVHEEDLHVGGYREARLHVDVYDTDVELPTLRQPTVDDERGRGLVFVNRLASEWGTKPAAGGKVVWFEMALSSDEPAGPP